MLQSGGTLLLLTGSFVAASEHFRVQPLSLSGNCYCAGEEADVEASGVGRDREQKKLIDLAHEDRFVGSQPSDSHITRQNRTAGFPYLFWCHLQTSSSERPGSCSDGGGAQGCSCL
jgi:hypothetical protein